MLDDPGAKAEREARWWETWFAVDYSWEGLARHEILGGGLYGEATLQDYWRRDPVAAATRTDAELEAAGELVAFEGRRWHIVHLPLCDARDVAKTWKSDPEHPDWERLTGLVVARLSLARETAGGVSSYREWIPEAYDGRARLDGGLLGSALSCPESGGSPLHLSCNRSWFANIGCAGAEFGPGVDFNGAAFSGDTRFDRATFLGDARFDSAAFFEDAHFDSAAFSGDARFDNAIFSGNTRFNSVTFSEDARFGNAAFSGYSGFDGATFSGNARFDHATFSGNANFDSATFSGDARFHRATFSGHASFNSTTFFYASFDRATFGGARFHSATFSGEVSFDNATFSYACFDRATFYGSARCHSATFSGDVSFDSATFSGSARFHSATFSGNVSFESATFEKRLWLSSNLNKGGFGPKSRASFMSAVFKGPVVFSARIEGPEWSLAGSFYAARFLDIADFSGAVAPGQAGRLAVAFEETQFEKALILTDGADRDARTYFRKSILPGVLAAKDGERDARLKQLEAGCRTVKIAMGKARDELREQRYYRFQLRARQHRSDIDRWEKAFGAIYGLVSDFGSSFHRPIITLGILTFAFGLAYWAWAAWLGVAGASGFWHGQSLALGGVFRPFALLAPEAVAKVCAEGVSRCAVPDLGTLRALEGKAQWSSILLAVNAAVALGVRLATTLQSILSGVLIFLFGLAVKRRFQIS